MMCAPTKATAPTAPASLTTSSMRERFEAWQDPTSAQVPARLATGEYLDPSAQAAWVTWQGACGSMCAAIKAADDKAAEGDYMLDSDDCICVIRGDWKE